MRYEFTSKDVFNFLVYINNSDQELKVTVELYLLLFSHIYRIYKRLKNKILYSDTKMNEFFSKIYHIKMKCNVTICHHNFFK